MGTTFAILSGIVLFALLGKQYRGGPENLSTKPRKRSIRAKWKGAGEPPAEFKVPKYKVGQKVTIRSPHEKDQFEGKTATVTERIYYEVVEADPSGTLLPVPGAETWGYVVDLMFDGLPLNVAETSLVPGGGAVAGDDTDWIFQVEYLKQVWPLIEGSRASTATLRKAMKIAAALDGNITFTQQGNPEDIALVTEMLTHLRQNVAAGEDEPKPTHGRTAHCKGASKTISRLRTATSWIHKGIIAAIGTAFTLGTATKYLLDVSKKLLDNTLALKSGDLRLWFNTASNEEVAAWGFAHARARIIKLAEHPNDKETKRFASVGVTKSAFSGDVDTAMHATFAYYFLVDPFAVADQVKLHIMQAIAILFYGGVSAVAVLNAALKKAPGKVAGLDVVFTALEPYRAKPQSKVEETE
jgi:hypothetical protein